MTVNGGIRPLRKARPDTPPFYFWVLPEKPWDRHSEPLTDGDFEDFRREVRKVKNLLRVSRSPENFGFDGDYEPEDEAVLGPIRDYDLDVFRKFFHRLEAYQYPTNEDAKAKDFDPEEYLGSGPINRIP